ncbi:hypothetical protein LOZ12_004769 [Ophidiomyces ophidiicola]|nr:hypothetical protein LOZ62_005058 [Ophidiomyces ophidiicola]KAI2047168.1 hypothetical protein LOZ44_004272 [Ophidiomyces ophidiicola]KAI2053956.1 hypothetical protein LOZ38_001485 [Ophidiomyces ophidiicola]KAI2075940.1 hypothetical protein LOZ37_003391 [Ophidiomyces ophidiicola]KAI2092062.1 hypothetical protein LOZ35_004754 [Ophidiomyces ophidiicola]
MPRLRRYRVLLVFAAVGILAFFHFTQTRKWPPDRSSQKPLDFEKSKPAILQQPAEGHNRDKSSIENATPLSGNQNHNTATRVFVKPPASPVKTLPPITSPPSQTPTPDSQFGPGGLGRLEVPELDRRIRWKKQPQHFPVAASEIIPLPSGVPKDIPRIQAPKFYPETWNGKAIRDQRLAFIKASFKRSWDGYRIHAWGKDELQPVYGGSRDPFMGWGATLVDGLDTLWIMGFYQEFATAVKAVAKIDFKTSPRKDIPVFETVIRYLGGLIGAYDISEQQFPVLLEKAVELAEVLMGSFDTPNRMPLTYYWWAPTYASQPHRASTRVVLAELGSLSVEFTRLAQLTNENKYYDAIARITNELEKFQPNTTLPGLWPAYVDLSGCMKKPKGTVGETQADDGTVLFPPTVPGHSVPHKALSQRDSPIPEKSKDTQPAKYSSKAKPVKNSDLLDSDCEEDGIKSPAFSTADKYTLGALADSTYEYLPKMHLLLGGLTDQYRRMYKMAMDTTRKYLLYRPMLPQEYDILFHASVTSYNSPMAANGLKYEYEGTHLGCFAGGMFALGAKIFGIDGDLDLARKLTDGCVWAYNSTKTGIMPEGFEVLPCPTLDRCAWNQTKYYNAIDPYEEERKSRHETWLVQKAEIERSKMMGRKETEAPGKRAALPLSTGRHNGGHIKRRDALPDDISRLPDREDSALDILGPEPTFVPQKQFAEQLIKEDRIPAGMTNLQSRKYILRPEAIESVFYMYRITGEKSWREKGWAMFVAIEKNTMTELGTSAIKDVTSDAPTYLNEMESFWLGETLKYFYLLFSDHNLVSLDDYVL